ncbi:hypothetical protein GW17_00017971 [Ensete ventricosum]|nr:hypothetical protein GW17_00017971 [Ensete ventricosum]
MATRTRGRRFSEGVRQWVSSWAPKENNKDVSIVRAERKGNHVAGFDRSFLSQRRGSGEFARAVKLPCDPTSKQHINIISRGGQPF